MRPRTRTRLGRAVRALLHDEDAARLAGKAARAAALERSGWPASSTGTVLAEVATSAGATA